MLTLDIKVKFYFYSYVLIIFWNIKKQNAFLKCILICRPCDKVKVLTLRCRISDFWSWCVASRRSNRVILFQILLVRWICTRTCLPLTNSLSTNIISGFSPCSCCFLNLSLILSGTIRSLHMAYFSIPTVLLSVRVLYWSVFSLDLFQHTMDYMEF